MGYTFKVGPEMVWGVLTAVAVVVLQAILTTPNAPTDLSAWLIALGAAGVRAGLGAILHLLSNGGTTTAAS